MPVRFIDDPEHWRNRAEEARTLADEMKDQQSRAAMLRVATDYELLAKRAEQRQQRKGVTPAA